MLGLLAALTLGGAILGGITKAVAIKKGSEALQSQAERNQAQVLREMREDIGDIQTEGSRFAGMQKAMIGASGVKLSSGSPLGVLIDTQQKIEKDIARVKQGGEFEAGQYGAQAAAYKKTRPWQVGTSLFNTAYQAGTAGATFF